jgi:hypothetical protein
MLILEGDIFLFWRVMQHMLTTNIKKKRELSYTALCSAARGPLDFLVIRVSTDLEVIQWSTFCALRYCAAEDGAAQHVDR